MVAHSDDSPYAFFKRYTDINGSPIGADDSSSVSLGSAGDLPTRIRPLTFQNIATQLEPMRAMFIGRYREIWETCVTPPAPLPLHTHTPASFVLVNLRNVDGVHSTSVFAVSVASLSLPVYAAVRLHILMTHIIMTT